MLTFVTGNKVKLEIAEHKLGKYEIKFSNKKLDLMEPQLDSIEEISVYKIQQAYKELKEECFITDVGWRIPALNNFPGPYMHHVVNKFTAEDWLNLMHNKEDRRIIDTTYLLYTNGKVIKKFSSTSEGVFFREVRNVEAYYALDKVISYSLDGKCLAESRRDGERLTENVHWDEFCKWYSEYKLS